MIHSSSSTIKLLTTGKLQNTICKSKMIEDGDYTFLKTCQIWKQTFWNNSRLIYINHNMNLGASLQTVLTRERLLQHGTLIITKVGLLNFWITTARYSSSYVWFFSLSLWQSTSWFTSRNLIRSVRGQLTRLSLQEDLSASFWERLASLLSHIWALILKMASLIISAKKAQVVPKIKWYFLNLVKLHRFSQRYKNAWSFTSFSLLSLFLSMDTTFARSATNYLRPLLWLMICTKVNTLTLAWAWRLM